jgi:hypothetical protein
MGKEDIVQYRYVPAGANCTVVCSKSGSQTGEMPVLSRIRTSSLGNFSLCLEVGSGIRDKTEKSTIVYSSKP